MDSDDPAAGLLNLFDVWIAFAAALLLASISYGQLAAKTTGKAPVPALEAIDKVRQQAVHYRVSEQNAGGDGERLGVAYRLKNGEVIYVPEGK
jgi:hypothetical protein